jgi:hypothetical protein
MCTLYYKIGLIGVAVFICVCVLSLMLGTPISLSNLLISSDILTESVSEGFSVPPIAPKPGAPSAHRISGLCDIGFSSSPGVASGLLSMHGFVRCSGLLGDGCEHSLNVTRVF